MSRSLLFVLATGFSGLASAQVCTGIVDDGERLACFDAARACASIESDSARLACFDSAYSAEASSKVRDDSPVAPHKPPVEAAETIGQSAEASVAPDDFGLQEKAVDERSQLLEATIVKVTTNSLKIDFLWLDNGHIWRENEDNRIRFKAGWKVRIEPGILNSFNLTMEGSNKILKVRRIR